MPARQKRIYALLAGINDYSPTVGKLRGCINDVDHLTDWLNDTFGPQQLALEALTDSDATRGNIIRMFRSHLSQAGPDDITLFQYSGHGARCQSAEPFKQIYPDGKDEGLVCYDSREPGGFDLADKELAVLLAEIACNNPHIALLLDCCHSGSATRGADDFTQARPRFTHEVFEERPLDTYLDGYYSARLKRGESLEIPASRHILLAACEPVQKAWEGKDHRGVFSTTLLDVLAQSGSDISYADLFVRARAAVRRHADDQTPQFETYQGFDAYNGFLGGAASHTGRRYSVYFDTGAWQVDCGALHGLPNDPDKVVELALYAESDHGALAGHAATTQVGAQKSELRLLDFEADPAIRFQAQVTSLPVAPLVVAIEEETAGTGIIQESLAASNDRSLGFVLNTVADPGSRYACYAHGGRFSLVERETGRMIQGADGYTDDAAQFLFLVMKRVAAWERSLALQNRSSRMDTDAVRFQFIELLDDNQWHSYPGAEATLDITAGNSGARKVTAKLSADNRSSQPLHLALAYLSNEFGVQIRFNERIEPTQDLFDLIVGANGKATFGMRLDDDEGDEVTHIFKLIVSTERIDDFLLTQKPIKIGGIRSTTRGGVKGIDFDDDIEPKKKLVRENEWFTKTIRVKLVRQLDQVSTRDTSIANGRITVKGHPKLQADISLSSAHSGSRGAGGDSDFYLALERQGMEMLNFAGTRGEAESILELTDIQNPEALREQPLDIELDLGLADDEYILPLTFDGRDILLAGDPEQDAGGRTLVHIDHIPDSIPDQRRSLGKALKLYFFKTYLKRSVNKLCWVDYKPNDSMERHEAGVADKVAAAQHILLLIHGIIGDTEVIARGLPQAIDANGTTVRDRFDLVLTYDYENLGTGIEATARRLKTQLREVGLHEHDDKRLTLLVHSMGGLVSRWFIEQEGGNQAVDHLVMCGTPNVGSPFGRIDSARNLTGVLTTLAMNTFPLFAPFGAGLLTVLGRSRKISPMLEQMNPKSDFIRELNAGDDPGVRYSILAGDIRDYDEEADGLVERLTAKIGKGALFDAIYQDAGHDIAVASASIQGVPDPRQPDPARREVACHHLNYFVSEAGLAALGAVRW